MTEIEFQNFITNEKRLFRPSTTKQQFEDNLRIAQVSEGYVCQWLSDKGLDIYRPFHTTTSASASTRNMDIIVRGSSKVEGFRMDVKLNCTKFRKCKELAGWDPEYNVVLNLENGKEYVIDDDIPSFVIVYSDIPDYGHRWLMFQLTPEVLQGGFTLKSSQQKGGTKSQTKVNIDIRMAGTYWSGSTITSMKKIVC